MTPERRQLVQLAIGRILRICSRSFQPGDIEEYERCRAIVLDNTDDHPVDHRPNYARDRNKGAAGD